MVLFYVKPGIFWRFVKKKASVLFYINNMHPQFEPWYNQKTYVAKFATFPKSIKIHGHGVQKHIREFPKATKKQLLLFPIGFYLCPAIVKFTLIFHSLSLIFAKLTSIYFSCFRPHNIFICSTFLCQFYWKVRYIYEIDAECGTSGHSWSLPV